MKPIQRCAIKIENLLKEHQGRLLCSDFDSAYADKYVTKLSPEQFGCQSSVALLLAMPEYFAIKGRGVRKLVTINKGSDKPLAGIAAPSMGIPTASFLTCGTKPSIAAPAGLPTRKVRNLCRSFFEQEPYL